MYLCYAGCPEYLMENNGKRSRTAVAPDLYIVAYRATVKASRPNAWHYIDLLHDIGYGDMDMAEGGLPK